MVEGRGCLGFADQSFLCLRIRYRILWQELYGNFAVKLSVFGEVYLPHPARAEFRANFVTTNSRLRSQSQPRVSTLKTDLPQQGLKPRFRTKAVQPRIHSYVQHQETRAGCVCALKRIFG
jgi:hypothetical protein